MKLASDLLVLGLAFAAVATAAVVIALWALDLVTCTCA